MVDINMAGASTRGVFMERLEARVYPRGQPCYFITICFCGKRLLQTNIKLSQGQYHFVLITSHLGTFLVGGRRPGWGLSKDMISTLAGGFSPYTDLCRQKGDFLLCVPIKATRSYDWILLQT